MPLRIGSLSKSMTHFVKEVNKLEQEDAEKAITAYCNKLEEVIFAAIKSITITIPPSAIQVQGSAAAQTNLVQIVLKEVVS
ncbi:MAG: hypothetical protein H7Y42_13965 [Chitinophagaceae bacterium]|nr:hypothetical protein [Chitinophagaceae bacterium]